jgi:uncharacterized membrane protein
MTMSNIRLALQSTPVQKTASYYLVHILVAVAVAYAVTGNIRAAITLSLLEPTVQACAYFLHDQAWAKIPAKRWRTLSKTASYYAVHLGVAAIVAYQVTGDLITALTLSLLEPSVQMVFYFCHEKLWDRRTMPQLRTARA